MMHLRTTLAIARKDALDIFLNKSTLVMLLTPVLLTILFAVLSGLLGSKPARLLVYNPERSGVSQAVSDSLARSQIVLASSPEEVASAFAPDKSTSYALGQVVPPGFDASLRRGEHPHLALYLNGNELNDMQRQAVVHALTDYASALSHPQPPLNIALTTIHASSSTFTLDLGTFYVVMALLTSISVGISLVSTLLVEEKEKKTLRVLLVSPASLPDVVLGKLLVGLVYQFLLSLVVMAVLNGFVGNLPLVFLFVLLIAGFGLALSLFAGSMFRTTSGLGGFLGVVSLLFILPAVFSSSLGMLFGNTLVLRFMRALPTYCMADGLLKALQGQGAIGSIFLDLLITLGCTLLCLGAAIWILHRQAAVTASI
jgi:ABC-2 type transport system permease protein